MLIATLNKPIFNEIRQHCYEHFRHCSITFAKRTNMKVRGVALTEYKCMIEAMKCGRLVAFRRDLFSDNCKMAKYVLQYILRLKQLISNYTRKIN